jgi:type VI secretion system secreted protein VgrG
MGWRNLLLGAVTDIDIVSSGDTHISSAGKGALHAALSLNLFANQGDIGISAASGKVQVQAHNNALMLLAKKVLEIVSTTDWITISAKKGVRINGGGAELVLSSEGIKGYTSGKNEMHASDHQTMGGCSKEAQFPGSKICPSQANTAAQSGGATVPVAD